MNTAHDAVIAFDGLPGHVVDYMASYMAVGGLGFAYWERAAVATV